MSLINKIKTAIAVIGIKPNTQSTTEFTPTVQEDVKSQEAVKRVRQHFEKNWESILAMSHNPHSSDCEDPIVCQRQNCWEWEPDKIVSAPYIVAGPSSVRKDINQGDWKEDRPKYRIQREKKEIKKVECQFGCHNKVYNQCYDCVKGY